MKYRKLIHSSGLVTIIKEEDNGIKHSFGEDEQNSLYREFIADVENGVEVTEEEEQISVQYSEYNKLSDKRIVTTNASTTELVRFTLQEYSMYVARLELDAINISDGSVKHIDCTIVAKRLNNGAILVDNPVVHANQQDSGMSQAVIAAPTVSGNDVIIRVTGITNKTIHWNLSGNYKITTVNGVK